MSYNNWMVFVEKNTSQKLLFSGVTKNPIKNVFNGFQFCFELHLM